MTDDMVAMLKRSLAQAEGEATRLRALFIDMEGEASRLKKTSKLQGLLAAVEGEEIGLREEVTNLQGLLVAVEDGAAK